MTITKLCSLLAKLEKTKSQARIQAIRSIVGHLSDIMADDWDLNNTNKIWITLIDNGRRRAKKGKRK